MSFSLPNILTGELGVGNAGTSPRQIVIHSVRAGMFHRDAILDVVEGFLNWRLWYRMSVLDIRRRYRRTVIGPFWTTLSMTIFIFSMGFVFATLWGMNIQIYLPYLASGFIAWMPINSIILESAAVYIGGTGALTSIRMPFSVFNINIVGRNIIVMFHHMVVYLLVATIFTVDINGMQLLAIPAIALYCINGVWISMLLGMVCARYRDITPLLGNILQIVMFISPIFWPAERLAGKPIGTLLIDFNVFYHYVDILRSPLLGKMPSLLSYQVVLGFSVIGWVATLMVFSRYRNRLIYWL